ncbi:STAS domain-containing protein [Microseira sp. BLCC-F43]|jgi:anti-anti-sigma factor|uniref:STAS domain-containing protein n=1 Tax=Microseira sp. BLCC-F43 TaxID=3153602 RepID=UPI0035B9747F
MKTSVDQNIITPVVKFPKVFDSTTASQFHREIDRTIEGGFNTVLIDLKEVACITSSGLLALVLAFKTVRDAGRKLFICSMNEQARILFELTGLDQVFESVSN